MALIQNCSEAIEMGTIEWEPLILVCCPYLCLIKPKHKPIVQQTLTAQLKTSLENKGVTLSATGSKKAPNCVPNFIW